MKIPPNVVVNCECCGGDMVTGLDSVHKTNVCIKCRDIFSKLVSRHYKCPKCHTSFSREYPYNPSNTKEIL